MKKIVVFAVMMAAFISCDKKIEGPVPPPEPQPEEKLPINIALSVATKATDAAYESGDKVGIYVSYADALDSSNNYLDNQCFTLTDGAWTSSKEIYWADQTTTADFYCYYPYGSPVDAKIYQFNVKADQSSIENYKASDFLWGKKVDVSPSEKVVAMSTAHVMSNILLYIEPGDGFTAEEFAAAEKTVKLNGLKTNSLVDLSTGVVSTTGDGGVMTPYWTGEYYKALVVPQSVTADNNLVVVTVAGVTYTLAKEFVFEPKTQHKLTLTVNQATSGLNISIESWIVDETEYAGDAK
jgi:hypothetical protein